MSHWSHKFMCCKNRWVRLSVLKWRNFNLDFIDPVYKALKTFVAVQLRKKQETTAIINFLVSTMWSLMSPEITESVTGNRIKGRTPIGDVTFLEQLAARHLYIQKFCFPNFFEHFVILYTKPYVNPLSN